MSAMSEAPDISTWLTKAEVSSTLGISSKTVERYALRGMLQNASRKRPGGGPALSVYFPPDVERVRAQQQEALGLSPFVVPADTDSGATDRKQTATDAFFARLESIVSPKLLAPPPDTAAPVPLTAKLWLTIAEAVKVSGLPPTFLRGLIESGKLPAIAVNKRNSLRIRRSDLEKI